MAQRQTEVELSGAQSQYLFASFKTDVIWLGGTCDEQEQLVATGAKVKQLQNRGKG